MQPTGSVLSLQHEADPAVQPEGKADFLIFLCMGNQSCLFLACGYLLLQGSLCQPAESFAVVVIAWFFYVNEDKMLTKRLLTLGGLESPAFPRTLSHARVCCALAEVCLPLVMDLPKLSRYPLSFAPELLFLPLCHSCLCVFP